MKRPEMIEDVRITDPTLRSEKVGELYAMVADCVKDWHTQALLEALEGIDIPNGKVNPLGALEEDPHLAAVGLIEKVQHPTEGTLRMTNPGVKFSKTPAGIHRLAATLGEHSVEVLSELGYSTAEINELLEAGATIDGTAMQQLSAAE